VNLEFMRKGSVIVVKIDGELDLSTSPAFREKIEAEMDQVETVKSLILNLEKTTFIDSSGLGAILGRYKRLSQRGGKLYAVNVPPYVYKIFELSGLLKIMSIYPTLEDAFADF